MVDLDTFVTTLYVEIDDFCKTALPPERQHPGRRPSLSRSEVLTLAMLEQWYHWASERDFYRDACRRLRWAFPTMPSRAQFNRLVRQQGKALIRVALALGATIEPACPYEVMDTVGVATRDARRRGTGWFPGLVDKGRCSRLGWYVGFRVLDVVTPHGALTGVVTSTASVNDRYLAERLLAARALPHAVQEEGAGRAHATRILADGNFWSPAWQEAWRTHYGCTVLAPPQRNTRYYEDWTKAMRRWLASHRQIVETVHHRLLTYFSLARERPHSISGFHARLAARVGLHNFCLRLNQQLGRPLLAVADLIDW